MTSVDAELSDPHRSRAVLIGISDYTRMPKLPAVATNVRDLAALLTDPKVWGLPARNCTVVLNPKSGTEVLEAIQRAATATSGTLLVYYAGHGLLGKAGDLRLVQPDGDQKNLYRTIRFDDIRDILLASDVRASGKVVILDCCYSGAAAMGPADVFEEVAIETAVEGTYVMTATTASRKALAPPGAKYTAFTGALLKVIDEGVRDEPASLSMETLFHQVATRIGARGEPAPEQRSRGDGHRIAIVRNRWTPPAEPPGETPPSRRRRLVAGLAAAAVLALGAATLVWHPWHARAAPRTPETSASAAPVDALKDRLDGPTVGDRRAAVAAVGALARGDAVSRPGACVVLQKFVTRRLPFPKVEPFNDPRLPTLGYRAPDVQDAVGQLGGVPCPAISVTEADLRVSQLIGDFRSADLQWSTLYRADVTKARFENAKLIGTHLWQMNGKGTSFEGADFDGAEFSYTFLAGANMRGASFRTLTDRRTLFYYTDLAGTDFRGAHLEGADLRISKINDKTLFAGATADTETLWPPHFDWRKAGVQLD